MTPTEYRAHPSAALRRAFFRGGDAAAVGALLSDNPYRLVKTVRRARRGSWSEAFSRAWAVGWNEHHRAHPAEVGAASPATTRSAS